MGTRTAPRRKTKGRQRKKPLPARPLAENGSRNPVGNPPNNEESSRHTSSETGQDLSAGLSPVASPAETAQAWAKENETCSTIKQVAAAALICGQKVSKTASALGVDRRTIQRWRKLDPEFQVAMVQTKQEVIISSRQYLLALAEEAVTVVETKLAAEQNAQVALSLLRGFGVLSPLNLEEGVMEEAKREDKQDEKEFCAQAATLSEKDSPGTEKEFCAQSATLDVTSSGAKDGENETALPAEGDEFPASLPGLSHAQKRAIEAFYEGKSLAEVAPIAKTSESTIRSWLCGDRAFFEALTALQFDRICHLKYRLLTLVKHAMQIVRTAINEGNGRIALALLRGLGVMR